MRARLWRPRGERRTAAIQDALSNGRSTGAKGLIQVVAKWHPQKVFGVGGEPSLLLIAPNINVGAAILAEYVAAEDGNITGALGHYLGLPAQVPTYNGCVSRWRTWQQCSSRSDRADAADRR